MKDFRQFIKNVDDVIKTERYLILRFREYLVPLVLRTADLKKATPRVLTKYGIHKDRFLLSDEMIKICRKLQ